MILDLQTDELASASSIRNDFNISEYEETKWCFAYPKKYHIIL